MKKLLFGTLAMIGSVVFAQAQETSQDSTSQSTEAVAVPKDSDAERIKIKTDELPEAVKQTLEDQEYKGWLINAAYHDRKEDRFEVEMKNGADTQTIKFSKEGERLDDK